MENENANLPLRFDKSINLGQVLLVLSFLVGGIGFYATAQVRVSRLEWRQDQVYRELDETKVILKDLANSQRTNAEHLAKLQVLIERDRK